MNSYHKKACLRWKFSKGSCSKRMWQQKQPQKQDPHHKEGKAQTNTEVQKQTVKGCRECVCHCGLPAA